MVAATGRNGRGMHDRGPRGPARRGNAPGLGARLCATHASALESIDDHTRLVHADINPKNILVAQAGGGWRVAALLDWEFSYSGCPYGDFATMARFGAGYPAGFLDGFRTGFAERQPADLPLVEDWAYVGRVLDMFAFERPGDPPGGACRCRPGGRADAALDPEWRAGQALTRAGLGAG